MDAIEGGAWSPPDSKVTHYTPSTHLRDETDSTQERVRLPREQDRQQVGDADLGPHARQEVDRCVRRRRLPEQEVGQSSRAGRADEEIGRAEAVGARGVERRLERGGRDRIVGAVIDAGARRVGDLVGRSVREADVERAAVK